MYVLCELTKAYSLIGNNDSAYRNAHYLLDIYENHNLDDSNIYYIAIATCGDCLLNQGMLKEAIPYLSESLEILSNLNLEHSLDYAITQTGLGKALLLTGQGKKAKETLENSYLILKHSKDSYDKRYLIECMDYLLQACYVVGDTITAIDLNKEAISFFDEENIEKRKCTDYQSSNDCGTLSQQVANRAFLQVGQATSEDKKVLGYI